MIHLMICNDRKRANKVEMPFPDRNFTMRILFAIDP